MSLYTLEIWKWVFFPNQAISRPFFKMDAHKISCGRVISVTAIDPIFCGMFVFTQAAAPLTFWQFSFQNVCFSRYVIMVIVFHFSSTFSCISLLRNPPPTTFDNWLHVHSVVFNAGKTSSLFWAKPLDITCVLYVTLTSWLLYYHWNNRAEEYLYMYNVGIVFRELPLSCSLPFMKPVLFLFSYTTNNSFYTIHVFVNWTDTGNNQVSQTLLMINCLFSRCFLTRKIASTCFSTSTQK